MLCSVLQANFVFIHPFPDGRCASHNWIVSKLAHCNDCIKRKIIRLLRFNFISILSMLRMVSISKMNKFNRGRMMICFVLQSFCIFWKCSFGTYDETIMYDFQLHFNYVFWNDFPFAITLCCCAMGGNFITTTLILLRLSLTLIICNALYADDNVCLLLSRLGPMFV